MVNETPPPLTKDKKTIPPPGKILVNAIEKALPNTLEAIKRLEDLVEKKEKEQKKIS